MIALSAHAVLRTTSTDLVQYLFKFASETVVMALVVLLKPLMVLISYSTLLVIRPSSDQSDLQFVLFNNNGVACDCLPPSGCFYSSFLFGLVLSFY